MYSLSRAGYYPKFLSLTGGRQVPYVALIVCAVVGVLLVLGLSGIRDEPGETATDAIVVVGRSAAEHRRVRCGHLVLPADGVVT